MPGLDKIKEENAVYNMEFSQEQILACGILKGILNLKLKTTTREAMGLLKQLEDNKEKLV